MVELRPWLIIKLTNEDQRKQWPQPDQRRTCWQQSVRQGPIEGGEAKVETERHLIIIVVVGEQ